ncbi:MAG TPA: hypothetical protein VGL44_10645 [Gaiellales bacterium]
MRWRAWQFCACHRSYLEVARRRRHQAVVDSDTELVIEGFPRTANTFAVFAFQTAQPRPVRLAHHLHASSQITAAADRGIPVMALVRPPADVVVSVVMWWPYVSPRSAYAAYADFYERIVPYRDRVVVARFDEVTSDFGAVIDRVNERNGTGFARFEHTRENVARCYRLIEERSRLRGSAEAFNAYMSGDITADQLTAARSDTPAAAAAPLSEMRVARPSALRNANRDPVRRTVLEPELSEARRRAERVYGELVGA